jgi:predicted aldo/keto reductase-like oxidoreductase
MICREKCNKEATCEVCGCCTTHCPGHLGIRRSLRLKTPNPTIEAAEPLTVSVKEQQEGA